MSCVQNHLKLPKAVNLEMVRCVKMTMSNEEEYTVKVGDIVAIQFVKDDKRILVRRGRIKDLVVVNKRELSTPTDNVSRIILDCSEQFTVKIIEIKFTDVIKIGGIDDEFEDYSDRITELESNFINGNTIPTRCHGMITKEEYIDKITKPDSEGVVEMDPDTGVFEDLPKNAVSSRGFAITK